MEAATRREGTLARSLGRLGQQRLYWWLVGVAVLVACVNLGVLIAQAHALIHNVYLNADNASALVLPALVSHAPAGSIVNLGNHPWYEPWWFMRATFGLPGYRSLWEAAPFLFGLLGLATVSACAWRALGRLAGLLCGLTLLATSEALRGILYVPESHGAIVLHVGVLCGALLIIYRMALNLRLKWVVLLLVGVALVVFTGAGLTDQLLLVSGLGPYMLAPLLCWLRFKSRTWRTVSLFALVTGVLSVLFGLFLTNIMQEQHVIHANFPVAFVNSEVLLTNLQNVIATLATLGGGDFFGASASGMNLLTFVAGALTLVGLAAVLRVLWSWRNSIYRSSEIHPPSEGLRELFVAYWGFVLLITLGVFALTSVSGNTSDGRYLIGAWTALAALLGILITTPLSRTVMLIAVSLFGVLNIRTELAGGVKTGALGPSQQVAGAIEHFTLAHGASIGYSGYWEAAPVMWETGLQVRVYPVAPCAAPTGLCLFYANIISTWYDAHPGVRTFLVTDTRPNVPGEVTAPPNSLGRPLAEAYVGDGMAVYVYNHDITADLSE
ncbi:MAG TPA: hypothetical protein VIJ39_05095 [Solirubrobacteraceae bacterium]